MASSRSAGEHDAATTAAGKPPAHAQAAADDDIRRWQQGRAPTSGFYIPYRYAQACTPRPSPPWLWAALKDAHDDMRAWLDLARRWSPDLARYAHADPADPGAPRFDQDWFPGLDGAMAYTLMRHVGPRRVVEVGSGHSTRFIARALRDAGTASVLMSIDPAPRRNIDALCSEIMRTTLSDADPALFESLSAGDVLFIDGSHIQMPGSDVEQLGVEIVPRLVAGTLLHVHDIFLPDPYPADWAWRGYNEQALIATLIGSGRCRIRCANAYLQAYKPEWLAGVFCPLTEGARASSMWLEII